MEIGRLSTIVLLFVLVGILLGVGILVFEKFGVAAGTSTDVVNETITISSSAGQTANADQGVTVTYFGNSTTNTILGNGTIGAEINYSSPGVITVDVGTWLDDDYDISYTYIKNSTATDSMTSMKDAISPIATTWLPLIVTVVVLAIILTLVISSFVGKRR